ncbi:hypothetical protein [Bifidobacterium olomucense]|uniref:Uncharacterized protein n=1 Tax=Bifidobacterium olomucense TaxID=2675324 RepID=A0A7Y0EZT4_9BIFI|nr:hypothetical protein [Bifidobacterium sp. DSM 109959]NMM99419.1 hypothetical protein [Bifidobacterium sp. DSM 109959]
MTLITQYFPNPLFDANGLLPGVNQNSHATVRAENQQLKVISTDAVGAQVSVTLLDLPTDTSMVFSIAYYSPVPASQIRNGCMCVVGYGSWTALANLGKPTSAGSNVSRVEFTTPGERAGIQFVFNGPLASGSGTVFDTPMLMTKSDWDWWQANKPINRVLSGNIMPLP